MFTQILTSVALDVRAGDTQPFKLSGYNIDPKNIHYFACQGLFPVHTNAAGQPDWDKQIPGTWLAFDQDRMIAYDRWLTGLKLHYGRGGGDPAWFFEHTTDSTYAFVAALAARGY